MKLSISICDLLNTTLSHFVPLSYIKKINGTSILSEISVTLSQGYFYLRHAAAVSRIHTCYLNFDFFVGTLALSGLFS